MVSKAQSPMTPTASREDKSDGSSEDIPVAANTGSKTLAPGVARIEALFLVFGKGWQLWLLYGSIALITYIASLASNTLYVYLPFATSAVGHHSLLGTIATATSIMAAVCKPFIAKIADIFSRPHAFLLCLIFYVLGLIIMASASTANAIAAGQVVSVIGSTGLDLVTTFILGDITSLENRALANGIASSPYILNAFISGYISQDIGVKGWRWGYGMFAILLPAVMAPCLIILFMGDHKARKTGADALSGEAYAKYIALQQAQKRSVLSLMVDYFHLMDGVGLLLFGIAWALILLPFTLSAGAVGGWRNPSMIAMEVVGWVLFFSFWAWELKGARHPLMPMRVVNRTFICCVGIDFLYYLSAYIYSTYYSSYIYVVRSDWSLRNYTFFLNTLGVGLCLFSLGWGLAMKYTHRYKNLQLIGIAIRAVGLGLLFYGTGSHATTGVLVMAQILIGLGGSASVLGTTVASQASVPHDDMATVISLLSLWTGLGGSIGSAIAAAIWTNRMPANLANRLAGLIPTEEISAIYDSITLAASEPDNIRAAVIQAYDDTSKYNLYLPGLILSIVPLIFGFWTVNYRLDGSQNAVENKHIFVNHAADEGTLSRKAEEVRRRTAQSSDV